MEHVLMHEHLIGLGARKDCPYTLKFREVFPKGLTSSAWAEYKAIEQPALDEYKAKRQPALLEVLQKYGLAALGLGD